MTWIGSTARAALAVLLVTVLAALAGCTAQPPPQPAPAPEPAPRTEPTQIVVGVDALGAGFNPHLLAHQSPVTTAVATLVLPSVFRPDATGALRLDRTIATSAEVVSTSPFTVSYELNVTASWSSNAPIAAEDFVYLVEQMRSQPGVADAAGYRLITDVRSRAGGKAVDVVFSEPYPQWRELFSDLLPASILKDAPGSWIGALANGLPVSGGPFRVASVDRARGEVVLARNDLYWDTPATLDQLQLRRLDPNTLAEGLRVGDVHVGLPTAAPTVRQTVAGIVPAARTQNAPQPTVTELGLRGDAGPLADPRVRQAIGAMVDREAVRVAVAPDALPADSFGLAPSQDGYAPSAPPGAPARPDPAAVERLLTAAGYTRSPDGGWVGDGGPLRLVIGAAAERPDDLRVAELVASQLEAAGVRTSVVAPPAAELFGQSSVTPTPPSTTAPPTPTAPVGTAASSTPSPTASPTPTSTATAVPGPGGGVRVDVLVQPRTVGGDLGTELASDFGCPQPTAAVADPPRVPTGFCFPALQPLLDSLLTGPANPQLAATVERVLWAQVPALPLFQPVTLVVSTPDSDAATGIAPGPLRTGPVTGAQRWTAPVG
ncbi:ABC transporter family substrate-binding protein [Pseudonocardia sp. H11422]|uniref:ABC transporter family substrate-binding protein n=1 Tax=Pseudonocardia sp. H11422 TaxID=2835866 RepID=UPI0027E38501|nr:ABC transporter family substrate-binding protein [Pseudonocardia sp. H11422]